MTLSQIKKFENLNISINGFEKQKEMTIFPLWFTDMKRDKHVNLLCVQDPQNNNAEHFVWIKDLLMWARNSAKKSAKSTFVIGMYIQGASPKSEQISI